MEMAEVKVSFPALTRGVRIDYKLAALEEVEKTEGKESMTDVMKELAMDTDKIPANPLKGVWA